MKSKFLCCAAGAVVLLAACEPEPAQVLNLDANRFQVIGTGYSESEALRSAISTANDKCAAQGKEAFVLAQDIGYQGVDQNTALIVTALTTAAAIGTNTPGYATSTTSSSDWRASLEVRCGPQPA